MNSALNRLRATETVQIKAKHADALEAVLATGIAAETPQPRATASRPINSDDMCIGLLADFTDDGQLIVTWSDGLQARREAARTIVTLDQSRIGAEVALAFPAGQRRQPLIMGVVAPAGVAEPPTPPIAKEAPFEAIVDKDRLELVADREITLRCGDASITLTKAGKIIIRGAYVVSRSSGVNRIKGGSVQIN